MRKRITKFAACLLIGSIVLTSVPEEVSASNYFDSFMPAAGGALATGTGTSVNNIKADNAKSAAKQAALTTHSAIVSENKGTLGANDLELAEDQGPVVIKEKAETPASKAMHDAEAGEESIVGTAAAAATVVVNEVPVEEQEKKEEVTSENSEETENTESSENTDSAEDTEAEALEETDAEKSEEKEKTSGTEGTSVPSLEVKIESKDVEEGEEDLSGTIIAQVQGYVNVRGTPSEDGEIVGKLYNESAGEWLGKEGDWYKIKSGNCTGYVKGEYVVTGEAAIELAAKVGVRTAVVNTTTLKVRQEPSLEATVLGLVGMEDRLTVLEEDDEWVKVSIEEGDGYLSKEYLNVYTEFTKAESKAEEEARLAKEEAERKKANAAAKAATKKKSGNSSSSGSSYSGTVSGSGLGAQVANYGLQFVGNPYVYGGTSLTNGTDCSGFTMGVYKNFGVSLPHSSGAQRSVGYDVGGIANAQPGDLICYSGHVAIYIGGGQIVHASTAKTGIKVSNANYRQILAVRRIF